MEQYPYRGPAMRYPNQAQAFPQNGQPQQPFRPPQPMPPQAPPQVPQYQQYPQPGQPQQFQQGMNQQPRSSDVIAKAAVRGKFLDFRNNLVHANVADYAMLHGIGGSKYAAKSTIKMMMTDYTDRNNVVVVAANIPPELPYEMMEVCMKNVGIPTLDVQALANCISMMARENKLPPSDNGMEYLAIPSAAIQQLQGLIQGKNGAPASAGIDYNYRQERVNVYYQQDGLVPVSSLQISRSGLRGTEISRLPWSVKISNFYARPNPQQNGTTAYMSSTIQGKKEAFINLSDADMFRCMKRVTRFLEVWESAVCEQIVQQGLTERDRERAAARQTRNQ